MNIPTTPATTRQEGQAASDGLKPCPFCGSRARMSHSSDGEVCNVRCVKWGEGCMGAGANCYSQEEATAAWNTRTTLSNLPVVPAGQAVGERMSNVIGVDKGALQMAVNVLRRAGKHEVANELQHSAVIISAIEASSPTAAAVGQEPVGIIDHEKHDGVLWYRGLPDGTKLYTSPQADALDAMTDEQRLEAFSKYCTHCGCKDPNCQCWNDE